MHTPGHAVVNLATLGCIVGHEGAVLAGAILPDLPIVILYLYERARGTPEQTIWAVCYQNRYWLAIIHGAHSLPLALIGAGLCWLGGLPALATFFASVMLHALADFPLHAIDAHRHFLPFSQYRFISPFSYWDERFHGKQVALLEALLVLGCSLWLVRRGVSRLAAAALLLVNLGYVRSYWRNFLRPRPAAPPAT
ncbi:MAG TPA: hypothetical protein PLW65_22220 [Pseudomonadota bacterium]|nr:hypothetical protein [Pseudomonadota bacterium]